MATITGASNEKVIPLKNWLGLHECPDGDTGLKLGEAARMENFRVTRDGNLQKRPGTIRRTAANQGFANVLTLWSGMIGGSMNLLSVCADSSGMAYLRWHSPSNWQNEPQPAQLCETDHAHIFGFNNKAYILTGRGYFEADGLNVSEPEGYIPLVAVSVPPAGGGETLEQVNKLSAKRRVWFTTETGIKDYQLPEVGIKAVNYVKRLDFDRIVDWYTADLEAGKITCTVNPPVGTNMLEVCYEVNTDFRDEVFAMKYAELYNGSTDTRVFLYGDGTNRAFYSGIDYEGNPRADYFPDLNVITVGEANTPITALIRHYSTLVAFKKNSCWSVQYGEIGLADGSQISAFYVKPINRSIGNTAMGQAQLVLNSPRTIHGSDIYEWRNNSSYSSNLSVDERQARRISDRVYKTVQEMSRFDGMFLRAFDNNHTQEYFVWECAEQGRPTGKILVHNYAVDAWYVYTGIRATAMVEHKGIQYIGSDNGHIYELSESAYGDADWNDVRPIDCRWESGSMDFGAEYMRKYSAVTWLAVKPEASTNVTLGVQTDRRIVASEKYVDTKLFSFANIDFGNYVFTTITNPQINRFKLKVKKFVYYKLMISCCNSDAAATVTDAEIKVRYTGYAK